MNLSGWPFRMPVSRFPRLKVRLGALSFGLLCFFFPGWGHSSGKRRLDRESVLGELDDELTQPSQNCKTAKLQNPAKASFWTWMSDFLMVLKTWGRKVGNSSKMMITRSHVATVFQHIFSCVLSPSTPQIICIGFDVSKTREDTKNVASVAQWHS